MLLDDLIGDSPGIAALREQVRRLVGRREAGRRLPQLLLVGETGTGKGLLARALHAASPRRDAPFVDLNCAAIPENLLESELFGVERGAYTGADRSRPGLFQAAHRGTLFLDEIALMPPALQGKLLKALEERKVRRVGSTQSEAVDPWILAATNEDLDEAMQAGRFRRDLYHRLAVVTLRLPPLRERGADVIHLAEHFLERACADYGLPAKTLSEGARTALLEHAWPGNVRELANLIERTALLSDDSVVSRETLDLRSERDGGRRKPEQDTAPSGLRGAVGAIERERLVEALEATGWNISRAAARLQVPRNTLRYRMERYGLREPPPSRRATKRHDAETRARRRIALLRVTLHVPAAPGVDAHTAHLLDAVAEKVRGFGGRVEDVAPDAVVAAFGLDLSEDAPRRAALAALAVQRAFARARRDELSVSAAIALHVDDCVVISSAAGSAVDVESRRAAWPILDALTASASPGSAMVSAAAAVSLRRRFELEPESAASDAGGGGFRLAGGERSGFGPAGRMTAFVGRHQEVALLASRLLAAREGRGQVVAVLGEAGIGKSRLLLELRRRLPATDVLYLEARCMSYGTTTAYSVVLEILRQAASVTESDDARAAEHKLDMMLATLDTPESAKPYLRMLLGDAHAAGTLDRVTPAVVKARTFDALRHLLVVSSRRRPVVLVVEDLHWIDKTSDDFLDSLVDTVSGVPVLLVATYRPDYEPAWLSRTHVTQLALPPLSTEDSHAVLRSAHHAHPIAPRTAELILSRGRGNPFFLEELAHALLEDNAAHGAMVVPETVHAVLSTRIERLPADERRLLQAASVLGKDVPLATLAELVGEDAVSLRGKVRTLQAADLLWEARPGEHGEYTFKHALTQEVAYTTLAPDQRRGLHARAARLEQQPEAIARHLTAADLADEAIPQWLEAGRRAIRRSANAEGVSHLTAALELLLRQPETPERDRCELELQLALGPALLMTRGYAAAESVAVYRRARTLCARLGDSSESFSALWGIFVFELSRGGLAAALSAGEKLRDVATRLANADLLVEAMVAIGVCLISHGRLVEGRRHVERAITLYDPARHAGHAFAYGQDPLVAALAYRAWALVMQDHEGEAVAALDEALRRAESLGHAFSRALALYFACVVSDYRGDHASMLGYAERLIALADEHRFPFWQAAGIAMRGCALAHRGDPAEGLEAMLAALEMSRAPSGGLGLTGFLRNTAEGHLAVGDVERALADTAEGLEMCERFEVRSSETELHRIRAEALARNPATSDEAEESFRRSMAVAHEQGASLFLRRTATSFAAYLRERGRDVEAAEILREAMQGS